MTRYGCVIPELIPSILNRLCSKFFFPVILLNSSPNTTSHISQHRSNSFLTSGGDYAYTLSSLRDRGIMSVVMVGEDCTVASILVDVADVALSLEAVLQNYIKDSNSSQTQKRTISWSTPKSGDDDDSNLGSSLCSIIQEQATNSQNDWVTSATVFSQLQNLIREQTNGTIQPQAVKEKAKAVRNEAADRGLIELDRRKLAKSVSGNSCEAYARLLPKGKALVLSTTSTIYQDSKGKALLEQCAALPLLLSIKRVQPPPTYRISQDSVVSYETMQLPRLTNGLM
jgi:hypothetical protein